MYGEQMILPMRKKHKITVDKAAQKK